VRSLVLCCQRDRRNGGDDEEDDQGRAGSEQVQVFYISEL